VVLPGGGREIFQGELNPLIRMCKGFKMTCRHQKYKKYND
jgi:hypothetical protein